MERRRARSPPTKPTVSTPKFMRKLNSLGYVLKVPVNRHIKASRARSCERMRRLARCVRRPGGDYYRVTEPKVPDSMTGCNPDPGRQAILELFASDSAEHLRQHRFSLLPVPRTCPYRSGKNGHHRRRTERINYATPSSTDTSRWRCWSRYSQLSSGEEKLENDTHLALTIPGSWRSLVYFSGQTRPTRP